MSELSPVLTDATTLRERVRGKVVRELERVFPVDLKGRTLEVKDIRVHAREYSPEEQKSALLTGDSLSEPVKGTLVLKDAEGKVVNEARNFTLTHLPWFSERHTIVMDGNEYQIANMLRRRPGAYTQRSGNGELHTTFNLSKGANFNVTIADNGSFAG
jgi:DNA-directed RNA polymerase beta subunit